jgi:predicted transposase/invertase (TIGR01784 family)
MPQINNPHDKFFKETFSRVDVTQSFIDEVFPSDIRDKINLNSLKLTNGSFMDADLSEHLADLVYEVEYAGEQATIVLLFEHKSYQEDFPEWQLLRYMTNIWKEEQKQKKKSKIVIPIIIHHGKTAWKKVSMKNYFGNPSADLLRFLPEFDYLLFSLNDFEDYQIANFKNTFLSTAAMLLKHSRDKKKEFLRIESFLIEKLKVLDLAHENEFITTIIYYLNSTTDLTSNELIIIFTKVSTTVNKIAMTAVEEIRTQERENLTFNFIKGSIQNGATVEFISKSFGLSIKKVEEIIQKIKSATN